MRREMCRLFDELVNKIQTGGLKFQEIELNWLKETIFDRILRPNGGESNKEEADFAESGIHILLQMLSKHPTEDQIHSFLKKRGSNGRE